MVQQHSRIGTNSSNEDVTIDFPSSDEDDTLTVSHRNSNHTLSVKGKERASKDESEVTNRESIDKNRLPSNRASTEKHVQWNYYPTAAPSVEQYFAEGMAEYARELKLNAEAAERKLLRALMKRQQKEEEERELLTDVPSWMMLGDMLSGQLVTRTLVTQSTQTDWKWLTMAVRWRHARTINTRRPPPNRPPVIIEYDPKAQPAHKSFGEESHHNFIHGSKSRQRRLKSLVRLPSNFVPSNEKGVDTSDLVYNPDDKRMRYTPKPTTERYFRLARCSMVIGRWRKRVKDRVEKEPEEDTEDFAAALKHMAGTDNPTSRQRRSSLSGSRYSKSSTNSAAKRSSKASQIFLKRGNSSDSSTVSFTATSSSTSTSSGWSGQGGMITFLDPIDDATE